jgi:predicted TIM-barrel fold metal-dependent hydrolase
VSSPERGIRTRTSATRVAAADGWDCHVHVFDAGRPVRPGHYEPAHRPLAEVQALARAHGVGRLVLVQPSVYGTDHEVLLQALRAGGDAHRGVAAFDPGIDDAGLDAMHAAGVRGVRLNLVSPVGATAQVLAEVPRLSPRLRERGWHLQWYVGADALPAVADARRALGDAAPPFVLDHLAGLRADLPRRHPAWTALAALADAGAWVKLSGWYRLGDDAPYLRLVGHLEEVARRFGDRLVWGSDWPHTSFPPDASPDYASLWEPVLAVLGAARARRIRSQAPLRLYG